MSCQVRHTISKNKLAGSWGTGSGRTGGNPTVNVSPTITIPMLFKGERLRPGLKSRSLRSDMKLGARGIQRESKDGSSGFGNLRQRLERSPGKGDAVVMAWSEGNVVAVSRHNAWKWEQYRDRRQLWIV